MDRFAVDGQYGKFLASFGIRVEEAMKKAGVAEDIFSHKIPTMSTAEYYRFMDALGALANNPAIAMQIATADNIESFSPPIFAAYCSKNARMCIERLGRYKSLIGPLRYCVTETESTVTVAIVSENEKDIIPQFLAETEIVFLINIIRKATKEPVRPIQVQMRKPAEAKEFSEYLKCEIVPGERDALIFSREDLEIPFISRNDAMWEYFEPELKRRLAELEVDDSFAARVRSALTELLPGGCSGIDNVAEKLGLSRRTLQRKLREENTNFQKQLNHTRMLLALHYIKNTEMTSNDIAYLLGYQELNSFLRAFHIWTGMSVSEYKNREQ